MAIPDFRKIYDELAPFVWRYAASQGIPADQLADVAQEVFVVVHQQLHGFEGRSTLRTWVAGITTNIVRAHRRRRATAPLGPSLEEAPEPTDPTPSPEDLVAASDAGAFVVAAMGRMAEGPREAFALVELEQLSAVEAAAVLGLNENTLRTRLRAARLQFNAEAERWQRGQPEPPEKITLDAAPAPPLAQGRTPTEPGAGPRLVPPRPNPKRRA